MKRGFTIVELLVVIVVIGILASLVLIGYNGVQQQARTAKIHSDLDQLSKAIDLARSGTSKSLVDITGQSNIAGPCVAYPDGTDLAKLSRSDPCWSNYLSAMKAIQTQSGVQGIADMTDPWGRPYLLDPNETDQYSAQGSCERDYVVAYTYPFKSGWAGMDGTVVFMTNSHAGCLDK